MHSTTGADEFRGGAGSKRTAPPTERERNDGNRTIRLGSPRVLSIRFLRRDELPQTDLARELVGDDYGGIPASVIFVDAEPGRGPRLHKHAYAELFFVLEGEATFTDGNEERVVRAGEIVIVPPDHPHAFVNSGTGVLRQIDVHLSARFVTEWLE